MAPKRPGSVKAISLGCQDVSVVDQRACAKGAGTSPSTSGQASLAYSGVRHGLRVPDGAASMEFIAGLQSELISCSITMDARRMGTTDSAGPAEPPGVAYAADGTRRLRRTGVPYDWPAAGCLA